MFNIENTIMYDELQDSVKSKAGVNHISPADCKRIAEDILETTKKRVSETTLKRFFGFVATKHVFSKYTLSVLTEYSKNDCSVTINTRINPGKFKKKEADHLKFDLEDGNLQSDQCMDKSDLENLRKSAEKSLPIKIKLTKKQVKDLITKLKMFSAFFIWFY